MYLPIALEFLWCSISLNTLIALFFWMYVLNIILYSLMCLVILNENLHTQSPN